MHAVQYRSSTVTALVPPTTHTQPLPYLRHAHHIPNHTYIWHPQILMSLFLTNSTKSPTSGSTLFSMQANSSLGDVPKGTIKHRPYAMQLRLPYHSLLPYTPATYSSGS